MDFAKLALTGLITGLSLTACDNQTAEPTPEPVVVEEPAVKPAPVAVTPDAAAKYVDVHDCAGLNTCKGLGGCKVSAEKLTALAEKAGTDPAAAGEAHACKGLNACKGLGGCGVDEATFATLKAKADGAAVPAEGG
jgi:hypothetical protein